MGRRAWEGGVRLCSAGMGARCLLVHVRWRGHAPCSPRWGCKRALSSWSGGGRWDPRAPRLRGACPCRKRANRACCTGPGTPWWARHSQWWRSPCKWPHCRRADRSTPQLGDVWAGRGAGRLLSWGGRGGAARDDANSRPRHEVGGHRVPNVRAMAGRGCKVRLPEVVVQLVGGVVEGEAAKRGVAEAGVNMLLQRAKSGEVGQPAARTWGHFRRTSGPGCGTAARRRGTAARKTRGPSRKGHPEVRRAPLSTAPQAQRG